MTRLVLAAVMAACALFAPSPVAQCDTDASCAALGGEPGYGVTAEKQAAYVPTLGQLTPDVNGVVIRPVPGGELIEWADHSQFVPMPDGWVSAYQGLPDEDPTVIEPGYTN